MHHGGITMKRITYFWFTAVILFCARPTLVRAQSSTDSLGDYARAARKDKKPVAAKHYDNDNLPSNEKLSVVGNAASEPQDKTADEAASPAKNTDTSVPGQPDAADKSAKKPEDATKKPAAKQDESAEALKKIVDQWKDKIAKQKDQVDLDARELDVLQREYRLRAAAFYADAGNRLRSPGGWDQEDTQYKQKIEDKQKTLDEAKVKLSDMQEEARKAGIPFSARE
ncbi:MAG: hypothetical protein NVS1B11_15030 [Terriglobales bacterium]